jgi:hypothetical protein
VAVADTIRTLVVAWFGARFAFGLRECGEIGGIVQLGAVKVGQQKNSGNVATV